MASMSTTQISWVYTDLLLPKNQMIHVPKFSAMDTVPDLLESLFKLQ